LVILWSSLNWRNFLSKRCFLCSYISKSNENIVEKQENRKQQQQQRQQWLLFITYLSTDGASSSASNTQAPIIK
jgi:hypothetical protein